MLAMVLYGLLGIAAILAMGAMIGTWRQYGSAWHALDAERANRDPVPVRRLTIRVVRPARRADHRPVLVPVTNFRAG